MPAVEKTRSDLSWLYQFDIIKSGYGFLIAAHYNHDLVSGCFVMHDQKQLFTVLPQVTVI